LTTGTAVFFNRLSFALDFAVGRAVAVFALLEGFLDDAAVDFTDGFLARVLDAADLVVEVLEVFRPADFEAAALFALGKLGFV
jgi:hypothetical protein